MNSPATTLTGRAEARGHLRAPRLGVAGVVDHAARPSAAAEVRPLPIQSRRIRACPRGRRRTSVARKAWNEPQELELLDHASPAARRPRLAVVHLHADRAPSRNVHTWKKRMSAGARLAASAHVDVASTRSGAPCSSSQSTSRPVPRLGPLAEELDHAVGAVPDRALGVVGTTHSKSSPSTAQRVLERAPRATSGCSRARASRSSSLMPGSGRARSRSGPPRPRAAGRARAARGAGPRP